MSCKLPVESLLSGVGQVGITITLGILRGKEVLSESRSRGRRKPATRGTGSPTWECSLGLAGWAAPGLPSQGREGFGLGVGSAAFAPGPGGPPNDLAPTKTGNIPERKKKILGVSAALEESRIIQETRTPDATKNLTERNVLSRANELGAFLKGEQGPVYFCGFYCLIKGVEKWETRSISHSSIPVAIAILPKRTKLSTPSSGNGIWRTTCLSGRPAFSLG